MRKTSLVFILLFFACDLCLVSGDLFANNLSVSNTTLTGQDTSADTIKIQFDISWANSWSDSANKDAAWVFIKYSTDGGTTWNHATLKTAGTNPSNFSQGSGTGIDIVVPTDKKGAFIQRAAQSSGALSTTSIQLVWDYSNDGVSDTNANAATTVIKVFGIEMVYIPQGGYYLGDTVAGTNGEFQFEASIPITMESEEDPLSFEAAVGTANAAYYTSDTGGSDDAASGAVFTVSSSFPKGYNAFYIMKYEITEGQYVDFLNTLTRAQQKNRVATDVSTDAITNVYVLSNASSLTNRNTITCPASGNGTTAPVVFSKTRADRACSYLSWMDLAAYADWAALRPMSELEYEKAARGSLYPVASEYAWGSTSLTAAATISGTEDGTETISTASANANYNSTSFSGGDTGTGTLRTGIYATSSTATRVTTGAGFYGVMELTGNVWERAVTIGNAGGRGFGATHGDGVLTTLSTYEGNATNSDWPGLDSTNSRGVTGAAGSGLRGGGWAVSSANAAARMTISSRYKAGTTDTTRGTDYGGRGVRTAAE